MTTIRRTLSPVPRPGASLGGEASSGASPLSKCSSCNQDYPPSSGSVSTLPFAWIDYVFYRVQAFLLGLFAKRSSRPLERQKLKGHFWRRSLFHFFVCFLVGVFVGFTPLASIKTSTNLMSKNQTFTFEQAKKVWLYDVDHDMPTNLTHVVEKLVVDNVSLGLAKKENETSNGTLLRDLETGFEKSKGTLLRDLETGFEKLLIIVTPTYPRMFQACYLNRLAYTLKLVKPPLLWVVVEMSSQLAETSELLRKSGVMYRHLVCTKNMTEIKDPRVHQRNVALTHIETHRLDGIVYFADDTNVYSTELFEHMRKIRRFGAWPIAKLKTSTRLATIVGPVCNGTQVIGWHTDDVMRRFRRFHAELSGFAFNSTILWDPKRWNRPTPKPIKQLDTVNDGLQVSKFIEQVVEDETEMEGIPENCSKVLVWHVAIESSRSCPREWSLMTNLDANVPLLISRALQLAAF